jgi:predicted RNA methylase
MNEHRVSGYARVERDAYQTIESWVTHALLAWAILPNRVWEPAAGEGHMVRALMARGYTVLSGDISEGHDFLAATSAPWYLPFAIVTNPPFGKRGKLAEGFIWKALELTAPYSGMVAMLLPADFDHAATRVGLFRQRAYSMRIVLTSRPRWFAGESTPKTNFVWHVWDWRSIHAPTVAYAGRGE